MSVIVTGMDMPGICGDCPSYDWKKHKPDGKYCKAKIYEDSRNPCYDDCPLKSVEGLIEEICKKTVAPTPEKTACIEQVIEIIREYCEEGAVG